MTNSGFQRILVILFLTSLAQPSSAAAYQFGYINCLETEESASAIPVFAHPCLKQPASVVSCGEKVRVVGRDGHWLKVALPSGPVRYVGVASVSQEANGFIQFEALPAMKPTLTAECSILRARHSPNQPPELLSSAVHVFDEYAELEADGPIDGVVVFVGRVGVDGRAHDMQIQLPMGHGLDEKARSIVEESKFAPALSDGRPESSMVYFDVAVRYTCIGGTARSTYCEPFLFVESVRKLH
jgi:hypothetical protein